MELRFGFRFGPVHTPLRRRGWHAVTFEEVISKSRHVTVAIYPPQTIATHAFEYPSGEQKVADAYVPVVVECDLIEGAEGFREAAQTIVTQVSPLIEQLRVRTQQLHLKLSRISDLEAGSVFSPEDAELPDLTAQFRDWIDSEASGRPPPYLTRDDWNATVDRIGSDQNPQMGATQVLLHQSLLLDAELAFDSDPRIGVMFSALACEVFVQSWLAVRGGHDKRLERWLSWADPRHEPDKAVTIRTYFDLGLFLATGRSLKEDSALWRQFNGLITARNEVAHRGSLPKDYRPRNALETARSVIRWVEAL